MRPPDAAVLAMRSAAMMISGFVLPLLNRRTGAVAIGAKHATIAGQRFEHSLAVLAVVEILASVSWHRLGLAMTAHGAGNGAGQRDHFTLMIEAG
jgi:hypothetical protein